MSIKLKQPIMRLATLFCFCFCKSSDAVEWSCFFFNSLNKMTNAAYENAMRQCPKKLMINFFGLMSLKYF